MTIPGVGKFSPKKRVQPKRLGLGSFSRLQTTFGLQSNIVYMIVWPFKYAMVLISPRSTQFVRTTSQRISFRSSFVPLHASKVSIRYRHKAAKDAVTKWSLPSNQQHVNQSCMYAVRCAGIFLIQAASRYPERLLVYHMGTLPTAFIGMGKAMTVWVFGVGCLVAAPAFYFDPNSTMWTVPLGRQTLFCAKIAY